MGQQFKQMLKITFMRKKPTMYNTFLAIIYRLNILLLYFYSLAIHLYFILF